MDSLYFYIDTEIKDKISGEYNWNLVEFNISSGPHSLKWEYVQKVSNGQDAGWVDNFQFIPVTETNTFTPTATQTQTPTFTTTFTFTLTNTSTNTTTHTVTNTSTSTATPTETFIPGQGWIKTAKSSLLQRQFYGAASYENFMFVIAGK